MAILFTEGFDWQGGLGDVLRRNWSMVHSSTPQPAISFPTGANGNGRAIRLAADATQNSAANLSRLVRSFGNLASGIVAFDYRLVAFSYANASLPYFLLELLDGGTEHLSLRFNASGGIDVTRNGTVLATASASVAPGGAFRRLEFKWSIHDTTGSFELRIDGATVATASNVDTRNGANAWVNTARWACRHGNVGGWGIVSFDLDNVVIQDLSGAAPGNDFLGGVMIETLRPNADVAVQGTPSVSGSPNYAMVDDPTMDATDYVTFTTAGQADRYGFDDLSIVPSSILAVTPIAVLTATAAGRTARVNVHSGGSTGNGATQSVPTSGTVETMFTADPATGTAWTAAGVNGAEISFELVS